jgi:mRNA interferase MazF
MVSEEEDSRGDIFLVALYSTRRSDIRKARPYVAVTPNKRNARLCTFIVAPLTTGRHPYPFRMRCRFDGKDGHVVADQLRAVDIDGLLKRLVSLSETTLGKLLDVLQTMFAV